MENMFNVMELIGEVKDVEFYLNLFIASWNGLKFANVVEVLLIR